MRQITTKYVSLLLPQKNLSYINLQLFIGNAFPRNISHIFKGNLLCFLFCLTLFVNHWQAHGNL